MLQEDNIQVSKQYPLPDISQLDKAQPFEDINELLDTLGTANIHYIIMRNWEDLPNIELGGNSDLDILIADEDLAKFYAVTGVITPNALLSIRLCLAKIADSYLKIDVRTPHDGYLPVHLAHSLLQSRDSYKNFFIPSKEMYFWSYFYHRAFQKPWIDAHQEQKIHELAPSSLSLPDIQDTKAIRSLFDEKGWSPSEPLDEWVWWKFRDNTKHYPEWKNYEMRKGKI